MLSLDHLLPTSNMLGEHDYSKFDLKQKRLELIKNSPGEIIRASEVTFIDGSQPSRGDNTEQLVTFFDTNIANEHVRYAVLQLILQSNSAFADLAEFFAHVSDGGAINTEMTKFVCCVEGDKYKLIRRDAIANTFSTDNGGIPKIENLDKEKNYIEISYDVAPTKLGVTISLASITQKSDNDFIASWAKMLAKRVIQTQALIERLKNAPAVIREKLEQTPYIKISINKFLNQLLNTTDFSSIQSQYTKDNLIYDFENCFGEEIYRQTLSDQENSFRSQLNLNENINTIKSRGIKNSNHFVFTQLDFYIVQLAKQLGANYTAAKKFEIDCKLKQKLNFIKQNKLYCPQADKIAKLIFQQWQSLQFIINKGYQLGRGIEVDEYLKDLNLTPLIRELDNDEKITNYANTARKNREIYFEAKRIELFVKSWFSNPKPYNIEVNPYLEKLFAKLQLNKPINRADIEDFIHATYQYLSTLKEQGRDQINNIIDSIENSQNSLRYINAGILRQARVANELEYLDNEQKLKCQRIFNYTPGTKLEKIRKIFVDYAESIIFNTGKKILGEHLATVVHNIIKSKHKTEIKEKMLRDYLLVNVLGGVEINQPGYKISNELKGMVESSGQLYTCISMACRFLNNMYTPKWSSFLAEDSRKRKIESNKRSLSPVVLLSEADLKSIFPPMITPFNELT